MFTSKDLLLFSIIFTGLFAYFIFAKQIPASAQTSTQLCQVNGRVLDVGTTNPNQCPSNTAEQGATGLNNVTVELTGNSPAGAAIVANTITETSSTSQVGTFEFESIPKGGIYNVCVKTLPTGYANYCNTPRSDNHDLFATSCAKIDTTNGCDGIRLSLTKNQTSSCSLRSQGDADCSGEVTFIDYLYFVRDQLGAPVPTSVVTDFNNDGITDVKDRIIVIATLKN